MAVRPRRTGVWDGEETEREPDVPRWSGGGDVMCAVRCWVILDVDPRCYLIKLPAFHWERFISLSLSLSGSGFFSGGSSAERVL